MEPETATKSIVTPVKVIEPSHVSAIDPEKIVIPRVRLTKKQKEFARLKLQNIGNSKPPSDRELMIRAGYSPATAENPEQNVLSKPAFKELLMLIDDNELLTQARLIALDSEDKRASLQAIDMLLKLKDRYPANKLKVQEYQDELTALTG